jgi:hypothetical protein
MRLEDYARGAAGLKAGVPMARAMEEARSNLALAEKSSVRIADFKHCAPVAYHLIDPQAHGQPEHMPSPGCPECITAMGMPLHGL